MDTLIDSHQETAQGLVCRIRVIVVTELGKQVWIALWLF